MLDKSTFVHYDKIGFFTQRSFESKVHSQHSDIAENKNFLTLSDYIRAR